jgi:hypothetical protein
MCVTARAGPAPSPLFGRVSPRCNASQPVVANATTQTQSTATTPADQARTGPSRARSSAGLLMQMTRRRPSSGALGLPKCQLRKTIDIAIGGALSEVVKWSFGITSWKRRVGGWRQVAPKRLGLSFFSRVRQAAAAAAHSHNPAQINSFRRLEDVCRRGPSNCCIVLGGPTHRNKARPHTRSRPQSQQVAAMRAAEQSRAGFCFGAVLGRSLEMALKWAGLKPRE